MEQQQCLRRNLHGVDRMNERNGANSQTPSAGCTTTCPRLAERIASEVSWIMVEVERYIQVIDVSKDTANSWYI